MPFCGFRKGGGTFLCPLREICLSASMYLYMYVCMYLIYICVCVSVCDPYEKGLSCPP